MLAMKHINVPKFVGKLVFPSTRFRAVQSDVYLAYNIGGSFEYIGD